MVLYVTWFFNIICVSTDNRTFILHNYWLVFFHRSLNPKLFTCVEVINWKLVLFSSASKCWQFDSSMKRCQFAFLTAFKTILLSNCRTGRFRKVLSQKCCTFRGVVDSKIVDLVGCIEIQLALNCENVPLVST